MNITASGLQSVDPIVIRASGKYVTDSAQGLTDGALFAKSHANAYALQIFATCSAFEAYARNKIHKLAGKVSKAALTTMLVNGIIGVVFPPIVRGAAERLARDIRQVISDSIKFAVGTAAGKAASNLGTAAGLRKVLADFSQATMDMSVALQGKIEVLVRRRLAPIQQKIYAKQDLTPEEDDIVATFYQATPNQISQGVTTLLGVPTRTQSREIQLKIYENLVRDFERRYFDAASSIWQSDYWGIFGGRDKARQKHVDSATSSAVAARRQQVARAQAGR